MKSAKDSSRDPSAFLPPKRDSGQGVRRRMPRLYPQAHRHPKSRKSRRGHHRYSRLVTTKAIVETRSWQSDVEEPNPSSQSEPSSFTSQENAVTTVEEGNLYGSNSYETLSSSYQLSTNSNIHNNTKTSNEVYQRTSMYFSLVAMRLNRSPSPAPRRLGDTTFRYDTLSNNNDEFRILRILKEATSQIKCELIKASLSQPLPYVALSYAWGDPEDTRTILLHGHEFPVTLSLWHALFRLRSPSSPVLVWADAVCINQKDKNEKNHQVQSMTGIYAKATSVAIWLGPETKDSSLAVQLLNDVVEYSENNDNYDIHSLIFSPLRFQSFLSLVALFERDYWYRLWVVQEIHNARAVDVYCGSSKLSWDIYLKASRCFRHNETYLVQAFPRFDAHGHEHSRLLSPKNQFSLPKILGSFGPALLARKDMDLLNALSYYRGQKACDPKDRVYGILGILSAQEQAHFVVDYTVSVRDLYINVADYLLTTTRRLDVICHSIHWPTNSSTRDGFPTWLPDWSYNTRVGPLSTRRKFTASGDTDAIFVLASKRRKLAISAVKIGTIIKCGTPLIAPIGMSEAIPAFLQWRACLKQARGFTAADHDAFCRVLSLDTAQQTGRWTASEWKDWVYGLFVSFLTQKLPSWPLDDQLKAYAKKPALLTDSLRERTWMDYIEPSMAGRRFCIASDNLLCLGSGGLDPGDIICVPLGCSTPIILRQRGAEWEYVGDIYVDGYMYGRAIEEEQSGQRQLENFVLI